MTKGKISVASLLLPKHYKPETEAEPKRNIFCVIENDFSSKILQVSYLINPPAVPTAMPVPDGPISRFSSWLDVFIKPLRGFGKGRNLMRLAFPDANHRDDQEDECREAEQSATD